MTMQHLKGFIFGALMMLITPALAVQNPPSSTDLLAGEAENIAAQEEPLPYFRLSYSDAEEVLAQALAERGAGAKIAATITNRTEDYVFSYRRPISVEIRGLRFDTGTRRFNANLVSIADNQVISAKAVTGRFDALIEVPVLKRSIRAGEVIKYEDIELRDYAKARARDDTATDMAALIGKTPQRIITAGRPIRLHELQQEAVIKKNDMVKMTFSQGAMEISTTGQAVEDGVQGSVIGVRNLTSKKIVQGTVHDANTVVISGGNETRISSLGAGGIYEN